jgi:hypothetical protein
MIREAALWLLTMFVIDPVMAEFNERMGDMRAPPAVVGQVKACAAAAPGAMADKAAGDIWWGVSTAISVAIGMTDATAALAKVVPECAAAAGAMRSLAAGSGST